MQMNKNRRLNQKRMSRSKQAPAAGRCRIGYLQGSWEQIDAKEWMWLAGGDVLLAALLAWLFYDSLYAWPPLLLAVPLLLRQQKKKIREKKRAGLQMQFREGLLAVSAALGAGYSVENAFGEALKDLYFLYPAGTPIIIEFQAIANGIGMNRNIEELLYAFAERTRLADAQMFAEVFAVCKRTGGNVAAVIQDTAARISMQTDVNREIETYLGAKKLEQRIMNVVPLAILIYVRLASPDFLTGIYKTLPGVLFMTGCLALYAGAYLVSVRIMLMPD